MIQLRDLSLNAGDLLIQIVVVVHQLVVYLYPSQYLSCEVLCMDGDGGRLVIILLDLVEQRFVYGAFSQQRFLLYLLVGWVLGRLGVVHSQYCQQNLTLLIKGQNNLRKSRVKLLVLKCAIIYNHPNSKVYPLTHLMIIQQPYLSFPRILKIFPIPTLFPLFPHLSLANRSRLKQYQLIRLMQKTSELFIAKQEQQNENNNQRIFFKLLEKVGVFGRYQIMTIVLWCLIMYLNGGLMFMTPFLFYEDPYVCHNDLSDSACKEFVCAFDEHQRGPYIPQETIHSLANHFGDYRCPTDKLNFDTVIAVMFFGACIGFLGLTLFGEAVGRKLLIQINLGCYVVGLTLTVFCANIYMAAVGLFFSTLGINNAYIICFYFILETVSDDHREKMSVICQTFYGVGVVLDILWYWWIQDWQIILGVCYLIPGAIGFVILTIFVKDTPSCLVIRNDSEHAWKKFKEIAKMNGVNTNITQEEIIDAKQHYEFSVQKANMTKFSVIDLFKYKSTRTITIYLCILFSTICFCFYAPSLMLDQFEFNIYINGLAVGVSQIIAYIASFFIVEKFKRKLLAYVCFGITGLCALVLIFVWDQGGDDTQTDATQQIIILILIFLFELAISVQFTIFYVYENEIYPTQARVIGTSIVSLVGEGVVVFASEILDFCFEKDFPVMIIFASLAALCLFIKFQMPETFQKVPEELILQFREKSSQYRSKLSGKKDILSSALSRGLILSP